MSDLQKRLRDIEEELHTLETATPRNSATVDRGAMSIVDGGSVVLQEGGTMFFAEGGSAISSNYDIEEKLGWQIGTERRGTSVVVLNDAPGRGLQVTTANSSIVYEEIFATPGEVTVIPKGDHSSVIIQLFEVREGKSTVVISGRDLTPTRVYKSQKEQWAYNYMSTFSEDIHIYTDMNDLVVRCSRLSVNNVS